MAVKCAKAAFHGSVANGATEGTFIAAYTGTLAAPSTTHCSSDLGTLDINMNSCAYILTGTTVNGDAKIWVECALGSNEIIIKATELGVTLKVPAQTPTSGGVHYTNVANGDVRVDATVEGITWTCEPKLACNLGLGGTEGNNADYTGSVTVAGANNIAFSEE